jgi:hypothetical protein
MHNCTHLLVVNRLIKLMKIQLLGFEGDGMFILSEDTADSFHFLGGVRDYFEFVILIPELYTRCVDQGILEVLECSGSR